jgi:hypothetical protein
MGPNARDRIDTDDQSTARLDVSTNRLPTPLNSSPLPTGAGIDKVALSFPIAAYQPDPSAWGRSDSSDPGLPTERRVFSTVLLLSANTRVHLTVHPSPTGIWAQLEWNPARVHDPHGTSLAAVDDVHSSAAEVWTAATELVTPADRMESALVRRLDVARDFNVTSPSRLLSGLVFLIRAWARSTIVWVNPRSGHVETIQTGGRSSHIRLYDKQAESPDKVTAPRLRWELQARRNWLLQYSSITTLADVSEAAVACLAMDRWRWSRMGTSVSGLDAAASRVKALDVSPKTECMLVGYLLLRGLGELPALAGTTRRKYEDLAKGVGALDAATHPGSRQAAPTVRLDWTRGVEVPDA